MTKPFAPRSARVALGALVLIGAIGVTWIRARVVGDARERLAEVVQLHGEGRATDRVLENARYHGGHAERAYENRWTLTGYAAQGALGGAAGLALLLTRRRRGAG